jgi:hypothetical protein
MNVKKIILLITTVIILASLYGVHLLRENRHFGSQLYWAVNRTEHQSRALSESISYVEERLAEPDGSNQAINTHSFESAIVDVYLHFGGDMPLIREVSDEWYAQFKEIYEQIVNKGPYAAKKVFLEKGDELSDLKIQLENMTNCLCEFREGYDQLSEWERHVVSWKEEQSILSEKVRLR